MVEIKENDFIIIDYDMYANNVLVQTTNEKKGKENQIKSEKFEPMTIIVGKQFILKALDEDILKNKKDNNELNLTSEEAYGKRDTKLLRTFPKSAFNEHKMRPVVGITYDFNGMYGTVKAITGGRILVDFNNPLAGKKIKLSYKIIEKIKDINIKVSFVIESILKLPKEKFKVNNKEKEIIIQGPKELIPLTKQLTKTFSEFISNFDKDYTLKIEELKK